MFTVDENRSVRVSAGQESSTDSFSEGLATMGFDVGEEVATEMLSAEAMKMFSVTSISAISTVIFRNHILDCATSPYRRLCSTIDQSSFLF